VERAEFAGGEDPHGMVVSSSAAEIRRRVGEFRQRLTATTARSVALVEQALAIGHPFVLPWLDDLLYEPGTRVAAARACLKIGGKGELAAAINCLERLSDEAGDREIGRLLEETSGQKFGSDRPKWRPGSRPRPADPAARRRTGEETMRLSPWAGAACAGWCWGGSRVGRRRSPGKPLDFEAASRSVPKPRELWPIVKQHCVPWSSKSSRTSRCQRHGSEQEAPQGDRPFLVAGVGGKEVGASFDDLPAGRQHDEPGSVAQGESGHHRLARDGCLPHPRGQVRRADRRADRLSDHGSVEPGTYPDGSDIEHDIGVLGRLGKASGKNYYNMNCQLAVVYIQAMNALQQFLGWTGLRRW